MSYQGMEENYSNVRSQKVPPGTAPKPYPQSQTPVPFRPGMNTYRPVNIEKRYPDDLSGYPLPPPPEHVSKNYGYDPEDDFPPPPPPAPPQGYGEDNVNTYGTVYSGEARYMRADDYRPEDRESPRGQAPSGYPVESNYANIQINIAPPTPTNKEFNYNVHSPPAQYEHPVRPGGGERPVPGPMVPPASQPSHPSTSTSYPPTSKEAEVDALTDLLVKNMTSGENDGGDYWGMCGRCGNNVSGSTNACSALDNVYHIGCFTCVGCSVPLQGKSFFAMETKPYCETCYVNTLERCSVCSKPITDRLLRATGKPYHPDCFTCVVCSKSLDGIPFTVDATNQIHCIEDFHKKFAPRCCVCQHPIMPNTGQDETVRIVAMDKSFHVDCYRCEDCSSQLSSEAEGRGCYPLDDHILCKNCNARRIQTLTTKMATEL